MNPLIPHAFDNPINFPKLEQVIFPGDKIVIVPDPFVACRPELLADFVSQISLSNTKPNDISVVLLEHEAKMFEKPVRDLLPKKFQEAITFVSHKAYDPTSLAMFGISKNDTAIKLNRVIVDADVVIPIERYEPALGMGYFGMQSVLYPRFADSETQQRFLHAEAKKNAEKLLANLAIEVTEIAYSLGVIMTVQVIANYLNEITNILYGDTGEIAQSLVKKRK